MKQHVAYEEKLSHCQNIFLVFFFFCFFNQSFFKNLAGGFCSPIGQLVRSYGEPP